MKLTLIHVLLLLLIIGNAAQAGAPQVSEKQRANLLKRFPAADTDKDGQLSTSELQALMRRGQGNRRGVTSSFKPDPGWKLDRFPDHAASYKSPAELKQLYAGIIAGRSRNRNEKAVVSYDKPQDGSLRIVGTGHSFMAPGYKTLPAIARMAGLKQPPLVTHIGGGMTGSARYKWEQENGIFQFDGKPVPKLLASIANGKWDAMMWGPYYQDEPEYYACWIEFCLKYNPDMKFFLSDAWPQLGQFETQPQSEKELTYEAIAKLGADRNKQTAKMVKALNQKHPNKVFVMPTSDAMVLAVREYHKGNLPGIEGIHKVVGGKKRSLWQDKLGHLGPGLGDLEGYVFYATLYGKSPETIEGTLNKNPRAAFPGPELDKVFRKIAWEAVSNNPLSGTMKQPQQ